MLRLIFKVNFYIAILLIFSASTYGCDKTTINIGVIVRQETYDCDEGKGYYFIAIDQKGIIIKNFRLYSMVEGKVNMDFFLEHRSDTTSIFCITDVYLKNVTAELSYSTENQDKIEIISLNKLHLLGQGENMFFTIN